MNQLSKKKYNKRGEKFYAYATFPSVKLYKEDNGRKWVNHLLFGDYIEIKNLNVVNGRVEARSRNCRGWITANNLQKNRILEVNFVDIGQGDGCHVVTPNDEHILIDAGETDNMIRYLTWRFNLYSRYYPLPFLFTSVISHSDKDHYKGFQYVFDSKSIRFSKLYHNGLVERPGGNPLGKKKEGYLIELINDTQDMTQLIGNSKNRKGARSTYCKTLYKALKSNPDLKFEALSRNTGYLEGFEESNQYNGKEFSIKVLGPITKKIGREDALKTINDLGKDKNGHSVILKIKFDKVSILLGGDVNVEFGKILHDYYKKNNELDELKVDVAKACHHGSNHFHYEFLEAINSAATVISSGDNESYAHPRPDAIGALGKCGYGAKPLVFSTELARSNKEITFKKLKFVSDGFNTIKKKNEKIAKLKTSGLPEDIEKIKKLKKSIVKTNKEINSFVTKFGMINLRTDGKKLILAQKYERPSAHGKWDIHELKYSKSSGRFELIE